MTQRKLSFMKSEKLTDTQVERIHEALETVPFAKLLGIELEDVAPGTATLGFDIRDDLKQNNGVVHGGAIASLIDSATGFRNHFSASSRRARNYRRSNHQLSQTTNKREGPLNCSRDPRRPPPDRGFGRAGRRCWKTDRHRADHVH